MKILFALSLLLSAPAFADGQESHGGNLLLCPGKEPVVLDFYNALLPAPVNTQPELERLDGLDAGTVMQLFWNKLDGSALGEEFKSADHLIGDIGNWAIADNLYDVNDRNLGYPIPGGCTLRQAAVRQGNGVLLDSETSRTISQTQLGMLILHEVLYYIATVHGQQDSSSTRYAVRLLMHKDLSNEDLYAATNALGVSMFWERARATGMHMTVPYFCKDAGGCRGLKVLAIDWENSVANEAQFHFASSFEGSSPILKSGSFVCASDKRCAVDVGPTTLASPIRFQFLAPNKIQFLDRGDDGKMLPPLVYTRTP